MAHLKTVRPTMMDVAKLAGVSYQTVSRVINNHPYVSDETRERVQEAIDTLDYRPNKAAIKLASKYSNTIAVLIYGSGFYGPTQMALSIEKAAKTNGFDVILTNISDIRLELAEALKHVNDWAVDGILMINPIEGVSFEEVEHICGHTPVVQIDNERIENIPSVVIDDANGIEQLVKHLTDAGHTRICEISGPLNWFSAQVRHQACMQRIPAHGAELVAHVESDWLASGGYAAAQKLLEIDISFTALIVGNDQMAIGALRALQEAGLAVPEDVSVVGFDDIPEAAYFSPPLTTIRQEFSQLGIVGFEYLMHLMDDPDALRQQHLIAPNLIPRKSTTPIA